MTPATPPGLRALRVRLDPCPELPEVGAAWQALETHAAPNFFTSWTWIGCWLRHLPPTLRPLLLQVHADVAPTAEPMPGLDPAPTPASRPQGTAGPPPPAWPGPTAPAPGAQARHHARTDGGTCVGLGLLVPHRVRRLRCWSSPGLVLHASGLPQWDAITIEHNGLLARRDIAPEVHQAAWQALLGRRADHRAARGGAWPAVDHILIPGASSNGSSLGAGCDGPDHAAARGLTTAGPWLDHRHAEPAWRADLAAMASGSSGSPASAGSRTLPGPHDIVASLGPGTRASVRRSLRRYAAFGTVALEAAGNLEEALHFLRRLTHWHQRQWSARGEPGAFANPRFEAFHRDLITAAWPRAQVELLRLCAGPQEIGLLYNFVHGTTVSTYQSGLNLELLGGQHHPGLVLHALAMQRARDAGFTVYDFLAGDARHKRQLGARPYAMHTVQLSRSSPIARLEAAWRAYKALRAHRKRPGAGLADAEDAQSA